MRRTTIALTAALVAVAGLAGDGFARPRRYKVERVEREGYVAARGSSGSEPEVTVDEVTFESQGHERTVSVAIADRAGVPVAATVRQDADGDGTFEVDEQLCGATTEPVAITGGADVLVKVRPGPCDDGTPATMTSGSVEVTFVGFVKRAPLPPVSSACPDPSPAPEPPREVVETYQGPAGPGAGAGDYPVMQFESSESETIGGATLSSSCGHSRVALSLEDATGLPVRAIVMQDRDYLGPEGSEVVGGVCGETKEPLEITPGAEILVYVIEGPCADGTPAAATTGTVTATFSG
jgi:hypothetical protein